MKALYKIVAESWDKGHKSDKEIATFHSAFEATSVLDVLCEMRDSGSYPKMEDVCFRIEKVHIFKVTSEAKARDIAKDVSWLCWRS